MLRKKEDNDGASVENEQRHDWRCAVAVRSTATLRVSGSIPARNKYLNGIQVAVSSLDTLLNLFIRIVGKFVMLWLSACQSLHFIHRSGNC